MMFVFDQAFQTIAKLSPGAMQATSNCSDRDVQDGTDFLVAPAVEIFHHDDGAVISTEFVEGSLDDTLALGALQGKSGIGFGRKIDRAFGAGDRERAPSLEK